MKDPRHPHEVNGVLDAFLDGELTAAERLGLEATLATDRALAAALEEQAALDRTLRHVLTPLGAGDAAVAAAVLERSRPVRRSPPSPDRPTRLAPTRPWLAALALAASMVLVFRMLPTPESVPSPSAIGDWRVANERGSVIWIPSGVPKKILIHAQTVFDVDGELVTQNDSGVLLRTPHGVPVYLAPGSMASLDGGIASLLHGSVWVRGDSKGSSTPESIWLGSVHGGLEIRGRGSFSIVENNSMFTVHAHRGEVSIRAGGHVTHTFASASLTLGGKGIPVVEAEEYGQVALGWAAAVADPQGGAGSALAELIAAHVAALADDDVGEEALASLVAHFGFEAVGAVRDALQRQIKEPAESQRRPRLARALRGLIEGGALVHDGVNPDPKVIATIESLFAIPITLEGQALEDGVMALAGATRVGPIPEIEAWIEKIHPRRRGDYLEKWKAVWRHSLEVRGN